MDRRRPVGEIVRERDLERLTDQSQLPRRLGAAEQRREREWRVRAIRGVYQTGQIQSPQNGR